MKQAKFLNLTVTRACRAKKVEGNLFGLELELEGRNVALEDVATKGWRRAHDGSLRGEAIEFVTNGGKTFDETSKLVDSLFKKFKEHGVKFNDSIRTSTHVHLNFSDKPLKKVFNFFALFTMLEEVLQHYSGEDRKGNLFCISSREGDAIIRVLQRCLETCSMDSFAGDRYKYAACNLSTLYKFGTVEVRTMRGANSAEQVNTWVSILNDMYSYSLGMTSPAELIHNLSLLGAEELMRRIFTVKNFNELMRTFPTPQNLHYSLMEGARLVQVMAFEFDEAFKAVVPEEPESPFNTLPVFVRPGTLYVVYRNNGNRWNLRPSHGGDVWHHGDRCVDDARIHWDGDLYRFVELDGAGVHHALRWRVHHEIADEGPPLAALRGEPIFLEEDDEERMEEGDEW